MNPDNHPVRDKIDHEKVEHDKSAKCYRQDSGGFHSKENTPVVRRLTGETNDYTHRGVWYLSLIGFSFAGGSKASASASRASASRESLSACPFSFAAS
jgi:hypothetical protein